MLQDFWQISIFLFQNDVLRAAECGARSYSQRECDEWSGRVPVASTGGSGGIQFLKILFPMTSKIRKCSHVNTRSYPLSSLHISSSLSARIFWWCERFICRIVPDQRHGAPSTSARHRPSTAWANLRRIASIASRRWRERSGYVFSFYNFQQISDCLRTVDGMNIWGNAQNGAWTVYSKKLWRWCGRFFKRIIKWKNLTKQ